MVSNRFITITALHCCSLELHSFKHYNKSISSLQFQTFLLVSLPLVKKPCIIISLETILLNNKHTTERAIHTQTLHDIHHIVNNTIYTYNTISIHISEQ